ncbi:unnamed protein product [Rhodiola kirilowii]
MDLKEGQNITRPPLLEGNKYGYWRMRMKAFLKSLDDMVWKAIEKDKWTEEQRKAEVGNAKVMNAIFPAVDGKNFKMISKCKIAKTA